MTTTKIKPEEVINIKSNNNLIDVAKPCPLSLSLIVITKVSKYIGVTTDNRIHVARLTFTNCLLSMSVSMSSTSSRSISMSS